ncbi:hydroxymethylpyrimidine/phosphomethylpyrimidine kinase [Aquimarina sp. RZ0]|uniref:hydroxymethylpyrimidine/phosphomethylpyrimidine kinase n=1 Tax=Aquimarina sp. RZ0 TaxID=2607730 RepID=UPI0011F24B41|nr:hydroxymethylpyrimidine/phosphomethylpyrimidine kinase [Aquimarina sp. RZ0]KAA1243770.1 hydroxymethylpyrimidine/phosphomethylpyrimidine kinase [Aquimarina sp. RZ0]
MKNHPYILTIAGFDPSGGAGLVADIKTFEALKCYGLSVCTANTIQNDTEFVACYWIDIEIIKNQISVLFKKFEIEYIKIGIVQNWKLLNQIIDFLLDKNNKVKIILDPVLRSSSAYEFHQASQDKKVQNPKSETFLEQVLDKIYLITPNYPEIEKLYPDMSIDETIAYISTKTNLFLKGGHRKENIGKDELFTIKGKRFVLNPKRKNISEKHGSGCILSSAITAQLALGFPLLKSCFRGKRYTEKVLSSNTALLGYHRV